MPWSYKDGNVPDAVKFLKPSIQKKAISVANAILRNGGSEGIAIAKGIKVAKKQSLVKVAFMNLKIKPFKLEKLKSTLKKIKKFNDKQLNRIDNEHR